MAARGKLLLRKGNRSLRRLSATPGRAWAWVGATLRRKGVRRFAVAASVCVVVAGLAFAALSWRLARGPISLDLATPWLVEAIQEKLGGQQRIEVGGTQIERGDNGNTSVRLLNVVLRDADGSVVASAPKVEVGLSGAALMTGQVRAERISLVGAEVSVRIESDGKLTVFAGGDKRPIAVAAPAEGVGAPAISSTLNGTSPANLARSGFEAFAGMLAWIDGLGRTGLDSRELSEIGLKNGTLVVEDQREDRRWTFGGIDVSLNRPQRGAVQFNMQSGQGGTRHWSINASVMPSKDNRRSIRLEAVRVPAKDLLLALRFADLPFKADLPISVRLSAEMGPTGLPEMLQGAVVAEAGFVGGDDAGASAIPVEHAVVNFEWNAARRALLVPLQAAVGGHRFTLLAKLDAPLDLDHPWQVQVGGGSIVLGADTRSPLVLNRIHVNAQVDPAKRQIHVEEGELGNSETGIAVSGGLDFDEKPRLMLGLAARRMPLAAMEKLWPPGVSPNVRTWVMERFSRATIERVDIAINAPLEVLGSVGPSIPDDALSIGIVASNAVFRPVQSLPEIRDAELDMRATGRTATVKLARGSIAMPSGRILTLSEGVFHIPDTDPKPIMSQTRFRLQGPVAAAAELLTMERLRAAAADTPLDPATSRGNVNARMRLDIPLLKDLSTAAVGYALDAEFTNFAAEKMIMGQRVEAASLRLNADHTGHRVKGDVKVAGASATLDYRKEKGRVDEEVRLQGVFDDASRDRLGIDLSPGLTGPVPIKLAGTTNGKDGRFTVEADLMQARIDELLPGLTKPASKPARATFTLVTRAAMTRLDDVVFDGAGALVRGNIVLDGSGNVVSANFPVYSLSSGDKISLKAERGTGGGMLVTLRGDVLDGRPFIKTLMGGPQAEARGEKPKDFDLDAKVGAIAGHNGEALRGLELKLARRDGRIRSLALRARLGRNATLSGDLRPSRSGQQAIHIESGDAGALFRFTDIYSRIVGGRMTVAMDPPSSGAGPQHGTLRIENFAVRGEAAFDRVLTAPGQGSNVDFAAMRVNFTRTPGQLLIRDGVVSGPLIGATIDGAVNYRRDDVHMRGTLVPLFGINNMFGRLPIVGLFLGGGSNEGLVGITYEVVGTVASPTLRVNPISAVAPGFIRKFFEFPGAPGTLRPPGAIESTR